MQYIVQVRIKSTTNTEMLSVLEWFKDNYGSKIQSAQAIGASKIVDVNILETTFNDAVATITAILTAYPHPDRTESYNLSMTPG